MGSLQTSPQSRGKKVSACSDQNVSSHVKRAQKEVHCWRSGASPMPVQLSQDGRGLQCELCSEKGGSGTAGNEEYSS